MDQSLKMSQDVPRCPKMSVDPDTQTLQHSAAQFRTKPQLDPNWTRLRMAYFSEKPGVVLRRNGHTAATCGDSGFGVGRQLNNCVGILRHQATYDFDDFSVSTIFNLPKEVSNCSTDFRHISKWSAQVSSASRPDSNLSISRCGRFHIGFHSFTWVSPDLNHV